MQIKMNIILRRSNNGEEEHTVEQEIKGELRRNGKIFDTPSW
jgi:hypothetical protein